MAAKVVPPFRFAIVEVGVYRGAYPTLKNFPFLKSLNLKTMISLIPEAPTNDLEDFCETAGVELIHHMVEKRKDELTITVKDVVSTLSTIVRASKLPIYVHCLDGSEVTGLVFACLRRLQAWHYECIVNEFCRYARSGEISSAEEKLVHSFKEIEIDEDERPHWLWQRDLLGNGQGHPFIKLIQRQGGVVQVLKPTMEEKEAKQGASLGATNILKRSATFSGNDQNDFDSNKSSNAENILTPREPCTLYRVYNFEEDEVNPIQKYTEPFEGFPTLLEALSLHDYSEFKRTKQKK
uniref:Tyrosine specific protein phosphatases domain-containing protein n=1 Tax=Hanusia phi TaxID=3032 RepID=A0A7S0DWD3_9CRYP|mmetsp:Transcript_11134/g.25233  ORF Transcript_11134/g.25233 Transcript_11134/m.25233 type:complete len:294 (+) Transcript_11134:40-921(+)